MNNKPVRLALVSLVAVISVLGLSQAPAAANQGRELGRTTLCCR
ncbi:hypothetical protein [Nocardioides halotolerans]|jgi:hypothetical protein|nr:hypothetical protein [Nocardioides halotolerans]